MENTKVRKGRRAQAVKMLPSTGQPSSKLVVTTLLPVVLDLTKRQKPEAR